MELNDFLERFLPDCHNRLWSAVHNDEITEFQFNITNFPEALQNFADKICEKQRENCAKSGWEDYVKVNRDDFAWFEIKNAKQPKIEEL